MSGFEEEDVKKLLLGCIKKPNKQAAALTAELLNQLARKGFFLFFFFSFLLLIDVWQVLECLRRAAEEAKKENKETVDIEHLKRVIPRIVVDFF